MNWDKKAINKVAKCLAKGMTYSEIARQLKTTPTSVEKAVRRYDLRKFYKEKPKSAIKVDINLDNCDDDKFDLRKEKAKLKWAIKPTKVKANKNKGFKSYIVIGDQHIPEHDVTAHKAIFNLMDDIKFDGIINLGDAMDLACISHWNKGRNKTLEGKRLKQDYIDANAVLDEFDKRLPANAEKHFFKGNHEEWIDQLIDSTPALDGLFDLESGLNLKERGYNVYQYNEIVNFGRLKVTHGIYAGMNPARTHVLRTLSNMLIGHVHSPEMTLVHSPAKDTSVVGYCNGCLCQMSPNYMRNKPHNWATGFAVLYVFPDGCFDVHLVRMVKHRFVFNGKIYSGK